MPPALGGTAPARARAPSRAPQPGVHPCVRWLHGPLSRAARRFGGPTSKLGEEGEATFKVKGKRDANGNEVEKPGHQLRYIRMTTDGGLHITLYRPRQHRNPDQRFGSNGGRKKPQRPAAGEGLEGARCSALPHPRMLLRSTFAPARCAHARAPHLLQPCTPGWGGSRGRLLTSAAAACASRAAACPASLPAEA